MAENEMTTVTQWDGKRPPGFHWRDGIYFNREEGGSVGVYFPNHSKLTIPRNEWPSIVAAVCALGETSKTYNHFLSAHNTLTEDWSGWSL